MRVLHIANAYAPKASQGGAARAAELLARAQSQAGADVTVFSTHASFEDKRRNRGPEDRGGVWVHFFPTHGGFARYFRWSFLQACLDQMGEFDIVHIHGIWSVLGTWGALAARRRHVPYVVSPHGMLNEWARGFRAHKKIPYWYVVERHTIGGAAWIHFTTEEEQRQARNWIGGKKSRIIPIGLDPQEFAETQAESEFRVSYGISKDVPVVAFLGRIHPIKGLDVLLQAMVRVKTEIPDTLLVVAGPDEDEYASRLQNLARSLEIENRVRWIGPIEGQAKWNFLTDADLFVLPSFSENFGLAAVEAMAVGCPVVLGCGVNIAQQVEAHGAGWVVPTEPQALAATMVEALREREARLARGKAGRRLVANWYDGEAVAREMLKGYEECLR